MIDDDLQALALARETLLCCSVRLLRLGARGREAPSERRRDSGRRSGWQCRDIRTRTRLSAVGNLSPRCERFGDANRV